MSISSSHCLIGQLYHLRLGTRFPHQEREMFSLAADNFKFLAELEAALVDTSMACHSFCLIGNEAHFLVSPSNKDSVVKAITQLRARLETLFVGQARHPMAYIEEQGLSLVDDECYAITLSRYIEQLPSLMGIISDASNYSFSSHVEHALRLTSWAGRLLHPHRAYYELGLTPGERRARYRALFAIPIPRNTLKQINYANLNYRVVGDDLFKRRLERRLARSLAKEGQVQGLC